MKTTCPNLKTLGRWKITLDPAAQTKGEEADPWYFQIPGRRGLIYPHGPDTLAVECKGHLASLLRAFGLPCHQEGDQEYTFLFSVDQLPTVAAMAGSYRKRPGTAFTPERLARQKQILEKARAAKLRPLSIQN